MGNFQGNFCRKFDTEKVSGKAKPQDVSGKAKPQDALVLWPVITNTKTCLQFKGHSNSEELSQSPRYRERGACGRQE